MVIKYAKKNQAHFSPLVKAKKLTQPRIVFACQNPANKYQLPVLPPVSGWWETMLWNVILLKRFNADKAIDTFQVCVGF